MCETLIPASEIEKNRVYLDLEVNLWTEYSWTHNKLNPAAYTGEDRSKFELADSWPDHIPKFKDTKKSCLLSQMQRKISQESDMDESDSDKKAYEDSLINVSGISINVSDSTPSLLRNSRRYTYSDKILAGIEKKEKAEADYVKYLMALLSSADSLGQVKQILSDKGELSEDMREALDRAINQEEKEQKKASKVPIQLIIKKIQIMKNRERIPELYKLYNKNQVKLQKYEHRIFNSTLEPTQSEREERRVLSNLGSGFLAELLWIDENLNPNLCTGEKKEKLKLAESWPNSVPNFEDIIKSCRLSQMQRKISQESDMDESDSDENAYEDSLINVSGISLE
ncbi:uncharacterized protein LOC122857103 [Aphidius gifuensis]|uniref:uncharacterized protein LOC122857103 n=1 Tax=Aphidius gifuensis TaxID=684658 RepID=UPI001CDBBB74|nr:uncharacterized protein LOC122857103 [Aphidius gifuensis]